jgi:hypothetical protein
MTLLSLFKLSSELNVLGHLIMSFYYKLLGQLYREDYYSSVSL